MLKRIGGILLLVAGMAVTVLVAVSMAFAIPSNFSVEGSGITFLVNLVTRYGLRDYIVLLALGVVLSLQAVALLLAPIRRKVAATAVTLAREKTASPEDAAPDGQPVVIRQPSLVRVFHAAVMGSAFRNPSGRSRQEVIASLEAGDIIICRSLRGSTGPREIIALYTVQGEQVGLLDNGLIRTIRTHYPDHRIGITVEEVRGGGGLPFTCSVRVGIYRG